MAMKKLRSLMPYFLSALCIIGYAFYMYTEFNSFNSSHVSEWEERMEPIRDALPLGIFEAGYLRCYNDPEITWPWLENNLREYKIQNFGFGIYLIQDIPE